MDKPTVTVIGLGNAGMAFLRVFTTHGYKVVSAFSRTLDDSFTKKYPDIFFGSGIPTQDALGDLTFITVPDDAIKLVAKQIASQSGDLKNKKFIHCSGALTSGILKPLAQKGALTASFHPISSIIQQTKSLKGIWFDVEGDSRLVVELENISASIGAQTLSVKAEHKPLLHAAAVAASNYLVVLAQLTAEIASKTGISSEQAMQAYTPLMKSSISNIEELGTVKALTGPIERNDIATVKLHLQHLESYPEIVSLYKILGRGAVEIARIKSGDSKALREIHALLT